jgi:thioredoxin reductase
MVDVIIVGGGPAGLSAALVLGRCCRSVVVFDHGQYRNAASSAVHGLLSREGVAPGELLRIAREQLSPYAVELRSTAVTRVRRLRGGFRVLSADGQVSRSRCLLLATGMTDRVPEVPGFAEIYGRSGFHCPVCDGWERRGKPWAALAAGAEGVAFALALLTWSSDVILFTDGARLRVRDVQHLASYGVGVRTRKLEALVSSGGALQSVVLQGGERVARSALFFHLGHEQRSTLPQQLGCGFRRSGAVRTDRVGATTVPGVYMTGDASGDAQFVSVAMAEGTKAAYAINKALRESDLPNPPPEGG